MALGRLHLALLIEVGFGDPLVQGECRARGLENLAAVDDPQGVVHAQPQPLKHGGGVPGIDAASVSTAAWRRTASSRARWRKAGSSG